MARIPALPVLLAASALMSLALPSMMSAAASATTTACSAQYQAAKTAGTLPAGTKWSAYLKACSASLATAPAALTAAPAATQIAPKPKAAAPVQVATAGAKTQTANQLAAHDRIKQCGVMWKAAKAAGSLPAGQTWPQYWSSCNTQLKG